MTNASIDRRVLLAALAMSACSCGIGQASAEGRDEVARKGCLPTDRHLDALAAYRSAFASTEQLHRASDGEFNLLRTSGDGATDIALDRALQRLASAFGVMPGFGFDPVEPNNAWASSRQMVPNTDGTVAFGTSYFKKWLNYDTSGI